MPGAAHSDREGPVIIQALLVGEDTELGASLTTAVAPGAWSIQYAPSNAAALALAAKIHFDLIVTHEKTSGHEDLELLREIRRVSPHTRLIILTGHSTPADVITSMREHAFSYFSQPICADDLVHMILRAAEEPCWDDGIEVVSAIPDWIRTRVRCELKTADRLSQFFNEIFDLPNAERKDVARAFREILLNAVEHGGQLDPSKYVEIDYVRARHVVTCRIVDPGPGFKRDDLPHAAIANPPDDPVKHMAVREEQGMRPGGFGILVAQHLVDDLIYDEDGNEVMLVKYLDAPPESP